MEKTNFTFSKRLGAILLPFLLSVFSVGSIQAQLACNKNIQLSLDENCRGDVTPDMVLEGTYSDYSDYVVSLKNTAGNAVPNPLSTANGRRYIGETLTATVTHSPTGNRCWGTISVEDKQGPTFDCSVELRDKMGAITASGNVFTLDCTFDISSFPVPQSFDNCDTGVDEYLISETITGDDCDVLTLTRVYGAEDAYGNLGDECTITINITQPQITVPADVTWSCEQYAAFPDIVKATALHPLILDPANACDLDENWDDDVDNPLNDSDPATCGTATSETDTDPCKHNAGSNYDDCIINPGAHVEITVPTPIHDPALVDGLEDADLLELSGSGIPNVMNANSYGCKFSVTWRDQKLEACEGVDTTIAFKIIRNWTILNWCTGVVTPHVQVIKVLDKDAPSITFGDDFVTDIRADQTGENPNHISCAGDGPLGLPDFADNCSGVDFESIRLYTPVGEGVPVYDNNGDLTGFDIPSPYLPFGTHTVTYEATDRCGNKATADIRIRVLDGIAPTPVCREITQVALGSQLNGLTEVGAEYFDEGSYDNCGQVWFLVRKMRRADNCDDLGYREDNRFRKSVHFCCDNIGDEVNIILRVYDIDPGDERTLAGLQNTSLGNRTNDCMIRVLVEDKTRPTCVAPDDVWTTCDEVPDNMDLTDSGMLSNRWGSATWLDNCGATIEELPTDVDIDLCGVGTVTRTWRAVDNYGNRSLGRCEQTIMIMAKNEYKINIPGDFEEECDDASPADLTYEEYACDLLAVNVETQVFPASPLGECRKMIKTWRVINWCEYDGFSPALEIPRQDVNGDGVFGDGTDGSENSVTGHDLDQMHMYVSNGVDLTLIYEDADDNVQELVFPGTSTGYYSYKQHIKIFDNTAPDVSYGGDTQFCGGDLDEDPCTGQIDLPINQSDLCTNTTVRWELSAFSDSFADVFESGNGTLSGRYPLGTHTVRYYVEDECGNVSQLDITFEIIDCKHPTPACYNGLSVELMPTGMVSVWASDFDASSFDYCHPITLEANVVTDTNGDGFIDANDYLTTNPGTTEVMLDCNHVGSITFIQLWVGELSDDDVNNWDYCVTFIEVQDNQDFCDGSKAALSGKITNEQGESVEEVEVSLNNGMSMTTSNDGRYGFSVGQGGDYTVTPMRNDDAANGVSTFDLVKISRHILNVERLNSNFKELAADANNDTRISTLDLVAIRKVILRVANEFPNNTSWRFANTDMQSVSSFNNLDASLLDANFTAIKVGDVTGDAVPNSSLGVDNRTFNGSLTFEAQTQAIKAGETFTIDFKANKDVDGYQMTMQFDDKQVSLMSIEHALTSDNNFNVADNKIVTSWNGQTSTEGQTLFSLVFTANTDLNTDEVLSITNELAKAEAYQGEDLLNVNLDFGTSAQATSFELQQNVPNPVSTSTVIGFNLPEATQATLTVSDVSGKVLQVIEGNYAKGYNEVQLENASTLPQGVLMYELSTSTHKATRKMTVIK